MGKKSSSLDFMDPELIDHEFRIKSDAKVRMKDYEPGFGPNLFESDEDAKQWALKAVETGREILLEEQEKLYASDTHSLLIVFQAMDAAGKDSAIKHVMSGVNPQGCQVTSFKHPSVEELDHNFLWRYSKAVPERGRIGIFNRSYYEDVLVVKVHPELLESGRISPHKNIWTERYQDIRSFEKHLHRNNTKVVKFFLNVSKAEQKKRFLERINNPQKHWKFSASDLVERAVWSDYMRAYEDAISENSTKESPWYIIPADHKWFARAVIMKVLVQTMKELKLKFPEISSVQKQDLQRARKLLMKE